MAPSLTSLSVFFPCFNEEKNIPHMVETSLAFLPQIAKKFEIIIIDDGSQDRTQAVTKALMENHSELKLISHPKNLGYGASIQSGLKHSRYDWIFFTDGDAQFDISQLSHFIPHASKYSVIIGYRRNRAEGQLRAFNARLFKLFVDLLFRLHVKDIDCAFKLIKSEALHDLPLISSGAMISTELLYRLKKKGFRFKQLGVDHYPRRHGQPTGNNPRVILKAGFEAIKLYLHMKFSLRSR